MASQSTGTSVVPNTKPRHNRLKTHIYIPEDVVEKIFSFLPIKELCSLSILSKRFRHSWKFGRQLSFDKNFARNFSRDEYRKFVNEYLRDKLNDPADKLTLYYDATNDANIVSLWIQMSIDLGIKELELDLTLSKKNSFILSYNLVNIESLKIMKLVNCELHLPLNSNGGLRHLREITLQNTRVRPVVIRSVFANCGSLRAMYLIKCNFVYGFEASAQDLKGFETLVVKDCSNVHSVVVNAPSLRTFHYHGKIAELKFCGDGLPHLSDVILEIAHPRGFQLLSRRNNNLTSLASVKTLTVTSTFLEGLSARFEEYEYKEVEFFFWKLKQLHLNVAPESFITPSDVAIFIKKCPRIERLTIDLGKNAFGNSHYWENYGREYLSKSQTIFAHLEYVNIKGFTLKELPVSMARHFLKNATRLRSLVLVKARIHGLPEFYSPECLRWGIISTAAIVLYDYNRDKKNALTHGH